MDEIIIYADEYEESLQIKKLIKLIFKGFKDIKNIMMEPCKEQEPILRKLHTITLSPVKEHSMPPQNMPLWNTDYLELVIFRKLQTQEKL